VWLGFGKVRVGVWLGLGKVRVGVAKVVECLCVNLEAMCVDCIS
jgi:hypothetical protein